MELESYLRFVLALIFVLGLIMGAAVLARRYGLGYRIGVGASGGGRGQQRRLGIVEVIPLDARRQLVLIQRDQVQHLVMLGPQTETTIETGINPLEPLAAEKTAT